MARSVNTLELAAGDSATTWLRLSSAFEDQNDSIERSFSGSLTAGDTVNVDVSNDEDPNTTLNTFHSSEDYTSTNFGGIISGDWRWVRLRKTGTTGAASIRVTT